MEKLKLFCRELFHELPAFCYWCLVLSFFRTVFIAVYRGQLGGNLSEVPYAFFRGWCLSLETAGFICLMGALLAVCERSRHPARIKVRLRFIWHELILAIFTLLFMVRLPYYGYFGRAFSMHLLGGGEGDALANFFTLVEEYQLGLRLAATAFLATVLISCFSRLEAFVAQKGALSRRCFVAFLALALLPATFACLAFDTAPPIASRLLQEAVLDDAHALMRVYQTRAGFRRECSTEISPAELRQKIAAAGGDKDAAELDAAFLRRAQKPLIASRPSRVVLIISESLGSWVLEPGFRELGLAENLATWQRSPDCVSVATMLAAGYGTMHTVNSVLTGLPYTGLAENTRNINTHYAAGVGQLMRRLGYKTVFFYGGQGSWQHLRAFALAQGFDEFFAAADSAPAAASPWGVEDAQLFNCAVRYMEENAKERQIFMVLLTTSNHPPYSVDVDSLGFPRASLAGRLPVSIGKDKRTLDALGHIWYADRAMGRFVSILRTRHPDTLFAVTGDHSERFNFAREQGKRTVSLVPCLFFGQGVSRSWLNGASVGTHMQFAASFARLLAPEGFAYTAYLPSVFENSAFVFNCEHYAERGRFGLLSENPDAAARAAAFRGIAAWRILKGNKI